MVYTVSGIVLHRLRRMARVGDVPREATDVISRMVAEVERTDPDFFGRVGDGPLGPDDVVETRAAAAGLGHSWYVLNTFPVDPGGPTCFFAPFQAS